MAWGSARAVQIGLLILLGACAGGKTTPQAPTGQPVSSDADTVALESAPSLKNAPGKNSDPKGAPAPAPTGGKGAPAPAPAGPTKAQKAFEAAVAGYTDAKSKGKLSDRCEKIASAVEDVYKADSTLTEGLFNAGAVLLECGKQSKAEDYFLRVTKLTGKGMEPVIARAKASIG